MLANGVNSGLPQEIQQHDEQENYGDVDELDDAVREYLNNNMDIRAQLPGCDNFDDNQMMGYKEDQFILKGYMIDSFQQ